MKIAIFGLGYVGITSAACLATEGHEIIGVDVNEEKIATINAGRSPIKEPGVEEFIEAAVRAGKLLATKDPSSHIDTCDLAFVCVGTPSGSDGSHNMSYIMGVTRSIASLINPARRKPLTVAYRSTMRPGSMDELVVPIFGEKLGQHTDLVELIYNPEFLRESVAVADFFDPPKIVIGTRDRKPNEAMNRLNAKLNAPTFHTNYREAELTKFVDNTFHATKVVFANEIGRICHKLGISARVAYEIFISDTKLNISPYYFRPGGPFGGSCLPKDVRALQYIAADVGANSVLVDSIIRSNEAHKHFVFEKCTKDIAPASSVLMLGIAFKADSDDLRESPHIDLARKLLHAGYRLSVYDPNVKPSELIGQNLGYAFSNVPMLNALLVSKSVVETEKYDLVIDTKGWVPSLRVNTERVININTLE